MNWLKRALSEDGTPSSHRVCMLLLLVFILNLIACAFFTTGALPDIPPTLADMLKWLFTVVVAGIGTGKVATAISTKGAPNAVNVDQG